MAGFCDVGRTHPAANRAHQPDLDHLAHVQTMPRAFGATKTDDPAVGPVQPMYLPVVVISEPHPASRAALRIGSIKGDVGRSRAP
jgi:hypothetical protein